MTRRNWRHQRRQRIGHRKKRPENAWGRRFRFVTALGKGWSRFWFQPTDPSTLGAIRLCTGLVLLYGYLSWAPWVLDFVGPQAWIDASAMQDLRTAARPLLSTGSRMDHRWWTPSVWFYVQDPQWIWVLYAAFLLAILCFTMGLMSRLTSVIVWIGHLSFIARSYVTAYGLDTILALLTFYLMLGPSGRAISLDALIRRRTADIPEEPSPTFVPAPKLSWSANTVIRLIQVHLCIIYFFSGIAKFQGASWRGGGAIWHAIMLDDLVTFDLRWLGTLVDSRIGLVCRPIALTLVAFEISFAFLIWSRRVRPFVLFGALMLHLGIAIFMGLVAFSVAMLTCCLAFVPPATIRGIIVLCSVPQWRRRPIGVIAPR
jgi:hypothetical protein